jgi:glycosyltransferase involved in cell wall biosynthesis
MAILLNEGRLAQEMRACGIEVKVIPESTTGILATLWEATRYLRGRRIHILHSHRYKENVLAALLAWTCRVPFVVRTQHGLPEPFGGARGWKQKLVQRLDRFVARFATDRVISVSSELRGHLSRYVDPRKVVVINNGLDTERVSSSLSSSEAKQRLGIPAFCRTLGYAGRFEPVKRLDLFLAAAKLIAARVPDARFILAGEGSEEARLREIARANALERSVLFLGHRNDIYDVLRAMEVFVLCSDHEGLPMVLLEALHLGVPVVGRRGGGLPEVIEDGVNGILLSSNEPAELTEACLRLLEDKGLRARLAAAGIASVAERFTAARNAAEVVELYRSLCGIQ